VIVVVAYWLVHLPLPVAARWQVLMVAALATTLAIYHALVRPLAVMRAAFGLRVGNARGHAAAVAAAVDALALLTRPAQGRPPWTSPVDPGTTARAPHGYVHPARTRRSSAVAALPHRLRGRAERGPTSRRDHARRPGAGDCRGGQREDAHAGVPRGAA